MASKQIGSIRKEYGIGELSKENVNSDPIVQFESWFKEAYEREGEEANATTLSTIGLDGHPEGRIVLLKFYSEDGFAFYTNYNSMKGQELENHAYASLTFHWKTLERQVRIRGTVEKTDPIISDDYFDSRPRESRIGAWTSPQSQEIADRSVLEENELFYKNKFQGQECIPRPPHWGGFIINPQKIEFWQGRASRLHDRIVYQLEGSDWKIKRLAP
ncbi:pyridoxamine 5'-phosphate oxidase [Reichenbachiella sp. MALMAid0571]|uniref:pyridoxamine 5'-phosphate oxidase n=1 Tax=Reichenbachiella sp. MALMAid0571 TaxID=3143939 RepID=UPI0032DF7DE2